LADKNIFDIYGGLDTRESYGNESSILSYTKAKNIDIDGKVVRRARGQTQVSIAPSGSTWAGIAPAPGGFIGGINEDGKYYRTDPVTLISTPVYSGIINMPLVTPTNLSGVYNEDDNTISLAWTNENGTDVDIEIWHSTDGEEYTLLATSPTGEWTYTAGIPTGYVDKDITADHHYYKVRAVNATKQSDFSNVWDYNKVATGVPTDFILSSFSYDSGWKWVFNWAQTPNPQGYNLQRSVDGGDTWTTVASPSVSVRTYIYQFQPNFGSTYMFRLQAIIGELPYNSTPISYTPLMGTPPIEMDMTYNDGRGYYWHRQEEACGLRGYCIPHDLSGIPTGYSVHMRYNLDNGVGWQLCSEPPSTRSGFEFASYPWTSPQYSWFARVSKVGDATSCKFASCLRHDESGAYSEIGTNIITLTPY
jgi:hypothetical protein